MSEIKILNYPTVDLVDAMGSDLSVVRAARVSVKGENDPEDGKISGLIGYLMKSRHGSPFEHATMTFYVKAPIFVFREFHRHRIASYNEMSGRYTTLPPEFYVPNDRRPLRNSGTSARPEFVLDEDIEQHRKDFFLVEESLVTVYETAWTEYQRMIDAGIANEVARMVLPVGIYSQMYVTLNLRALMNFLSLRVDSPDAAVRSRPQYEIQQVAEAIEGFFAAKFSVVHEAFVTNGRTAP